MAALISSLGGLKVSGQNLLVRLTKQRLPRLLKYQSGENFEAAVAKLGTFRFFAFRINRLRIFKNREWGARELKMIRLLDAAPSQAGSPDLALSR